MVAVGVASGMHVTGFILTLTCVTAAAQPVVIQIGLYSGRCEWEETID